MAQDPLGRLVVPNVEKKDQVAHKPDDIVEATDATSVAQGVVDDHADILNAQAENREQPSDKRKSLLRVGPGLITGVADDDPSGIGTYSVAGAQFGYQLLWLAPVCVPLMIAVQEMCGRLALVRHKGQAATHLLHGDHKRHAHGSQPKKLVAKLSAGDRVCANSGRVVIRHTGDQA